MLDSRHLHRVVMNASASTFGSIEFFIMSSLGRFSKIQEGKHKKEGLTL